MSITPLPDANFSPTLSGYTGQGTFKFWCQKVLPLIYDDSLSYYELLCKVVNFLNNVIQDIDSAEGNISALSTAYNQLQDYVNTYFDNLDVQEEINNKLDEMVESGELEEIVSSAVSSIAEAKVEELLPSVVEEQIDGAVEGQLGDVVEEQLPGVVNPQIPGAVSNWLDENVDPTHVPIVDSSLITRGAAADAKATGEYVKLNDKVLDEGFVWKNDIEFEIGYYSLLDGTSNPALGIMSSSKLTNLKGLKIISGARSLKMTICAYNKTTHNFVGAWNGSLFAVPNEQWTDLHEFERCYYFPNAYEYGITIFYTVDAGETLVSDGLRCYYYSGTDTTLTIPGKAADAKAVGDAITELSESVEHITEELDNIPDISDISSIEEKVNSCIDYTKNIFKGEWSNTTYSTDGSGRTNATSNAWATTDKFPCLPNTIYTFSWGYSPVSDGYAYVYFLTSDDKRISYSRLQFYILKTTVTTPQNCAYFAFAHYKSGETNWRNLITEDIQVELGNKATEYVPHIMINSNSLPYSEIKSVLGYPSNTVKSVAHRGNTLLAPQCTAPSYIIARKSGYTIAENDIDITIDGEFVMWHDGDLNKLGDLVDINGYLMYTDGTNYYWYDEANTTLYTWNDEYEISSVDVSTLTRCNGGYYAAGINVTYGGHSCTSLTLSILKRIDFGVYFSNDFKGTQILTLEEWCVLCKLLGMEIYIDRKLDYSQQNVIDAATIVKKVGMGDHSSWLGLTTTQWGYLRSVIANCRVGVLHNPDSNNVVSYASYNTGRGVFFDGNASDLTEESVRLGTNAGFDVECYYVGYNITQKETVMARIRELIGYGITGITNDGWTVEEATANLLQQY